VPSLLLILVHAILVMIITSTSDYTVTTTLRCYGRFFILHHQKMHIINMHVQNSSAMEDKAFL